jgi:mono/diheme cytochrome c family protein
MRFLGGILFGILLTAVAILAYIRFGNVPVAVSDTSWKIERQVAHQALGRRIDGEMVKTPPIAADETAFHAAAPLYLQKCAFCHGTPAKSSMMADAEFPDAPQLFKQHRNVVVGVSDDEPGETYWKIKNGIRLSGMPSYKDDLSDTQMWQVAQMLANADKLPADVMQELQQPAPQP